MRSMRSTERAALVLAPVLLAAGGWLTVDGLRGTPAPPEAVSTLAPAEAASSGAASSGAASGRSASGAVASSPASGSAGAPAPSCRPTRMQAPAIGLTEPVQARGLSSEGKIFPPPHMTMWYDGSPEPGRPGVAIVAGHVTYDGPDDFYRLRDLRPGDAVTLTCAGGRSLPVRVTRTAAMTKQAATTDPRLWGPGDRPVVAFVTCDLTSPIVDGHHRDNVVVWAEPGRG